MKPEQLDYYDRFMDKVQFEPNSGCWLWTACTNGNGYGLFQLEKKTKSAHRISYMMHKGDVPEGKELDHLCRVRSCVNPDHLEPVTRKENLHRSPIHEANRTHCPQGHEYTDDNLYIRKGSGHRICKTCAKARTKERYRLNKRRA